MHILEHKYVNVSPGVEPCGNPIRKFSMRMDHKLHLMRDLNKWREEEIALQEVVRVWEKSENQI